RALLLAGSIAAVPLGARAQPARLPRGAYLGTQSAQAVDPRLIQQFKVGLVENKLIDGSNLVVEYHWADGSPERVRALAQALGARSGDVDIIVTSGPLAVREL